MARSLDLSKVDVPDFLDALQVENVSQATDEEVLFSCPFPGHAHGDETPSAYMNVDSTAWFCHSCKRKGNAITFLAEHENISRYLAQVFIRQEYDSTFREPEGGTFAAEWDAHFQKQSGAKPTDAPIYLDEELQYENYALDWPLGCSGGDDQLPGPMEYMYARGFDSKTLNDWGVGYDEVSDRVTIPVRDVDGRLVGWKARAVEPGVKPKYRVLGDKNPEREQNYGYATYNGSQIVFGLDRVGQTDEIVVVEGELNVIAMHQMGFTNTVALGGSYISPRHKHLLKWHADRLTIFFDSLKEDCDTIGPCYIPDKAGLVATSDAIDVFQDFMPVRVVDMHVGDPSDYLEQMGTDEAAYHVTELLTGAVSSLHVSMDFDIRI